MENPFDWFRRCFSRVARPVLAAGLALSGLAALAQDKAAAPGGMLSVSTNVVAESPAMATNAAVTTAAATNAPATNNPEADKAWRETHQAFQAPAPPAAWQDQRPTPEEVAAYYLPAMNKAIAKAKDFYTRFPDHPMAAEARRAEFNMMTMAVEHFGDTNRTAELAALKNKVAHDPKTSEEERFPLLAQQVVAAARAKLAEGGEAAMFAEEEKGARELIKEFPRQAQGYAFLLEVAGNSDGDKAKALAQELLAGTAPEVIKDRARVLAARLDALGKPVAIAFEAVDGRKVDLAKMKGKVVLVDFWATWCVPCVAELPNVKAAYDKLHARGFEIVGISLDHEKEALETFVEQKKMAWPQYFEEGGTENKYAAKYGVNGIPTMWLVDKQGNLRDLNARGELEEKVSKLLDEK